MALDFEVQREKTLSKEDLCYLILKNKSFSLFKDVPIYQMDICGRAIKDWVKDACSGNEIIEKEYSIDDNIFDIIRNEVRTKSIVCVLYADSPLISKIVLQDIWNMFLSTGESICRLPRGFILEVDALKNGINMLEIKKIGEMFAKEFTPITNLFAYKEVQTIMRERIVAYHMERGVIFRDSTSVHIDAEVEIGSGTIIFPNNYLYSNTRIGKNCVLLPNNTVINSQVGDKCELKGAFIEDSQIENGKLVLPFTCIIENRKEK